MKKDIFRISVLFVMLVGSVALFNSCNEEEEYIDRMLNKKDQIFMDGFKAITAGGNKATIINSKEELEASVGKKTSEDVRLMGINFENSTLVLDSDTIKYKVPTNLPNVINANIFRGLTGAYSFSYSIETQKVKTDNEEQDKIDNAKRDYIIGIVVDKLPSDAVVYLDKNLNFIDSTLHANTTKIGKIKRMN